MTDEGMRYNIFGDLVPDSAGATRANQIQKDSELTKQIQELNSAVEELDDRVGVSQSGSNTYTVFEPSLFALGDIIRVSSGPTYFLAKANDINAAESLGIVIKREDESFTYSTGGHIDIGGLRDDSGDELVPGTIYYLSATGAGKLSKDYPTTEGHVIKPVLVAEGDTAGVFLNYRGTEIEKLIKDEDDMFSASDTHTATQKSIKAYADAKLAEAEEYTDGGLTDYASDAATFTNKTIDADDNTISNLEHGAELDAPAAGTGVTHGHISDGSQTIAGEKTFSTFPVTPSAAPDADYEVANKKYVDDELTDYASDAVTFTNKTIDADDNTISNLEHGAELDAPAAGTGVTHGHISDGSQTIAGEKTFSTFPVTPSAAPDADYEVANKKYVDDNAGGGGGGVSGYQMYVKYPYYPSEELGQIIALGSMTIGRLSAYLPVFPGVVISDCSDASDWTATGDASGVAVETTNFKEGGSSISFDKSGTSSTDAGISVANTEDITSKILWAWVYLPDVSDIIKIRFKALKDASNYYYYDNSSLTAGWNLICVDDYASEVGSLTGSDVATIEVVVVFCDSSETLSGMLVDHVVMSGFNQVKVKVYNNGSEVGEVVISDPLYYHTTTIGLSNTSVSKGDILSFKMSSNETPYQGQSLSVGIS